MSSLKVAFEIIQTIKEAGFEAYICGGAVRDHLLSRPYEDIDIATSMKPSQGMKLFESKPTGIKYGSITIFVKGYQYELTTFRTDGPSDDQRHPDYVYYGLSAEEDALRRDFKMNGMFMTLEGDILDYVSGKDDIEAKLISAIGDPLIRFSEDGLRIMRALYFQAKLDFDIEANTLEAMKLQGKILLNLPKERILNELLKILKSPYAKRAFKTMQQLGYDLILPGIKDAIAFYLSHDIEVTIDVFFGLSTYFSKDEMLYYPLPNKQRHKYEKAASRASIKKKIDRNDVYQDGLEIMKLAGWLLFHLDNIYFKPSQIEKLYETLPVKSILDLNMKPKEMMALAHKPAGAWIKDIQDKMVELINKGELKNTREDLFVFFRTHYIKKEVK
jgi:tRNA nucleotidyltransferase (CCA-adding enzyme)